jgi:restriction endonuclease S subunit
LESLITATTQQLLSQRIRFRDKSAKELPDWQSKKIKDVLAIGNGKDYRHLSSGRIPVYGTGGLMTFVDSFLHDGETVCIGRKGTIDTPMFIKGKIWTVDTLFYTHSFVNVIPKFIYYVFKSIRWKEYNEASGVPSLSKSTIEKISIEIPSQEEQTQIANFLTLFEDKLEVEKAILQKHKIQKHHLLSRLFI